MDTRQFGLTSTRYHSTLTTGPDSTHFCKLAAAWTALPYHMHAIDNGSDGGVFFFRHGR